MPEYKILNNNIILVFDSNLGPLVDVNDIKGKLIEIYSDEVIQPITNIMMNVQTLVIPEKGLLINTDYNRISLSDQNIGKLESRNLEKFAQIITMIRGLVKTPNLKAYGYNFNYVITSGTDRTVKEVVQNMKTNFFKEKGLKFPKTLDVLYMTPTISFNYKDQCVVKFTINYQNDSTLGAEQVLITANAHFADKELLPYTKLVESIKEIAELVDDVIKDNLI